MPKDIRETKRVRIQETGKDLDCLVCGHDRFRERRIQMNTPGMTFFGLDWANESAACWVCARCGHVHWFTTK